MNITLIDGGFTRIRIRTTSSCSYVKDRDKQTHLEIFSLAVRSQEFGLLTLLLLCGAEKYQHAVLCLFVHDVLGVYQMNNNSQCSAHQNIHIQVPF